MKPLTDEEVDALWLQIMGGSIREYNPMKAREYRAMVRAGMMKAAEIADRELPGIPGLLAQRAIEAIRIAAGGQHG